MKQLKYPRELENNTISDNEYETLGANCDTNSDALKTKYNPKHMLIPREKS